MGHSADRNGVARNCMNGVSVEILNDIGEAVGIESNTIINLGISLGFLNADIDRYRATNHQGIVSPAGTKQMLFDWKKKTSSREQRVRLWKALEKAKLVSIAEDHLLENVDTVSNTVVKALPKPRHTEIAGELYDMEQSREITEFRGDRVIVLSMTSYVRTQPVYDCIDQPHELLCLKCGTSIANITDAISKTSNHPDVLRSEDRYIMNKECRVQLIVGHRTGTGTCDVRVEVIILTTANVIVNEEVSHSNSYFKGTTHTTTRCTGCSQHIGWKYNPTRRGLNSFHAVFLYNVICGTYESRELICLKCGRFIAKITDVIRKEGNKADVLRSEDRYIMGEICLVQLMIAHYKGRNIDVRHDVITMTTADVTVDKEVSRSNSYFGGTTHTTTWCTGCTKQPHQIGWYYNPIHRGSKPGSKPFYAVFLDSVIHHMQTAITE